MTIFRTAPATLALAFLLLSPRFAAAVDWKPIDPAHLALKTPRVQADADAEALFWDVRIADDLSGGLEFTTTFEHYLRIKIFTDRGREAHATVDIPYYSGMKIKDVAARTIRPDGTIVELKKSDIYERTLLKANDVKVKALSFAVPAIERGAIVEYRWREIYSDSLASNLRLVFSRDMPVHTVTYSLRPLSIPGVSMSVWSANGRFAAPEKTKDGFTSFTLTDVPADSEEEFALPPFEVRPWLFISYMASDKKQGKAFWAELSTELYQAYASRSKPNDDIRKLAAEALAGTPATDAARVAALVSAAKKRVRRVDVDTAAPDDRRKAKENKNAGDALKRGLGDADDLMLVCLALANAAGLDARVAAVPDRAQLLDRSMKEHPYFVSGRLLAVKSGTEWIFSDPANEHAPAGELRWQFTNGLALVADPKELISARTRQSDAVYSQKKRTGTFRLTEDGTLEGEARLTFTGHWADTFREQEDEDAPAQLEKSLIELVTARLPGAEVSAAKVENVGDPRAPYANTFRIRVPGYAQRTGSRLFLQPAMFQKGVPAMFSAPDRTSELYLRFPWSEEDVVRIELPDGYTLEEPTRPPAIEAGAASYQVTMTIEEGGKYLVLRRKLVVGARGEMLFKASSYGALKQFFDDVHRGDGHTIVLRKKADGQ